MKRVSKDKVMAVCDVAGVAAIAAAGFVITLWLGLDGAGAIRGELEA